VSSAPLPEGYDRSFALDCDGHGDCILTVGIDKRQGTVTRFVVRLHLRAPGVTDPYTVISRFDHNGLSGPDGHDIYDEGLHVDVTTPAGTEKASPQHTPLPPDCGKVIQACIDYYHTHANYFVNAFRGATHVNLPDDVPDWVGG